MVSKLLLNARAIVKRFPGVLALDGVSLAVNRGEVHALLGENGAGKSTLLKILSGAHHHDHGVLEFNGNALEKQPPFERQRIGIVTVYQEFNLMPNMSVAENIFIGREPGRANFIDWSAMQKAARKASDRLDLRVDPRTLVSTLSVAEQQLVEIARALTINAKLIILDEPTAALSDREVEKLHKAVRDLRSEGIGIIYVTHRLNEVAVICDRFTVLRDGKLAGSGNVPETTTEQIIKMMVGRNVEVTQNSSTGKKGDVIVRIDKLSRIRKRPNPQAVLLRDMSFEIRKGEILGLAGLVGAGRTDFVRAIFGAEPYDSGTIYFEGNLVAIKQPSDAMELGIALVPEDRKRQGLFLTQSIRQNLSLPSLRGLCRFGWFIDQRAEDRMIEEFRQNLRIRMTSSDAIVGTLSGGNQQKVILARCMALKPKVLIVDEPTRGIDIGVKAEVHQLLRKLAADGTAVVVVSSELSEIMSLCERIVTVKEGCITGNIPAEGVTEEQLMKRMALGADETHQRVEVEST